MKSFRQAIGSCFGKRIHRHDSLIEENEHAVEKSETKGVNSLLVLDLDENNYSEGGDDIQSITSSDPEGVKSVTGWDCVEKPFERETEPSFSLHRRRNNTNLKLKGKLGKKEKAFKDFVMSKEQVGSTEEQRSKFVSTFGPEYQETLRQVLSGPPDGSWRGGKGYKATRPRTPLQKKKLLQKHKKACLNKGSDNLYVKF